MKLHPQVMVLSSVLDDRPRLIQLDRPMTVAEVVAAHEVRLDLPTIAVATGFGEPKPVLRGEWHVRLVRPGETLSFVPVPGRGGLTSILAAIAGIALAVFAPWAAGFIAGTALGLTGTAYTIATSLIASGIMLAGQFIISRLLPAPGAAGSTSAETVYTARASSNRAMPNEPMPVLYGRLRYPPPYASRPYAEFIENDQYLYQLHCMSAGHVDVESWEVGDTLVWTKGGGFTEGFEGDTEIEIVEPGAQVTLFPANVVTSGEVSGQTLPDQPTPLGPFTVNPAGTEITRIAVDYVYPFGLGRIDAKGNIQSLNRRLTAEYRRIDDAGAALGNWTELFDEVDRGRSRTPMRKSRSGDVVAGRYEVRLLSHDSDLTDWTGEGAYMNRISWAGLRGYLEGFETPAGVTLIATKIRATEHLSQNASGRYFFVGTRKLPVFNGNEWTAPQATRSIAWAAADMLRNDDYGLGLPDSDYDRAWLATYSTTWASRGDRFDALFDRRWPAGEALDAILRAGRAYHVRLGSVIGFVRDEPRQVRRMAFTPDTIVKDSFRREDIWFSEEAPDHLEVTYLDGQSWRERSVLCALGAIGQERPQQNALFGITDHDHAWREGIFQAAENAYRRSFRTFQVEREGRMLVRGDAVVLSDPIYDFVEHARVQSRSGNVLTLDRPVTDTVLEYEDNVHIVLRDKRGREWGPCRLQLVDGATVTLLAASLSEVEAQHGTLAAALPDRTHQEAAHATILREGESRFNGLVVEARPVGHTLWEVVLVNDDPRVHEVDGSETKPSPWTPPAMLPAVPERPIVEGLYAWIAPQALTLHLEASWQPSPGADRYESEISYDTDAATDPGAADWTPVQDSKATRLSVPIQPQAVTLRVAAIGQKRGPWAYKAITDHPQIHPPRPGEGEDSIWTGIIDRDELRETVDEATEWLREPIRYSIAQHRETVEQLFADARHTIDIDFDRYEVAEKEARALSATYDRVTSEYTEEIAVVAGELGGVATRTQTLEVAMDGYLGAGAVANAFSQQLALIEANEDRITIASGRLDTTEAALTGYLGANAVANTFLSYLSMIEANGSDIDILSTSLSQVQASLNGYMGANAVANAFLFQQAQITANEDSISLVSTSVNQVEASLEGVKKWSYTATMPAAGAKLRNRNGSTPLEFNQANGAMGRLYTVEARRTTGSGAGSVIARVRKPNVSDPWEIEVVSTSGGSGSRPEIFLDGDGHPAIRDTSGGDVTHEVTIEKTSIGNNAERANALGVLSLDARASDIEGDVSALAAALLAVEATVGSVSAGGGFKAEVGASPGGGWSNVGLYARAGNSAAGDFQEAAIFLQARSSGSPRSRVIALADQFVIASGSNLEHPFVFQSGVLTMNATRVNEITAGIMRSLDNRFRIDLNNRRIVMSD